MQSQRGEIEIEQLFDRIKTNNNASVVLYKKKGDGETKYFKVKIVTEEKGILSLFKVSALSKTTEGQ